MGGRARSWPRHRGFNEDFWFTNGGLPHTDQLRLVERFTRVDFDTMRYEVTVDDPAAYTRPWKAAWNMRWVGGEELPVYFCQDNRPWILSHSEYVRQ